MSNDLAPVAENRAMALFESGAAETKAREAELIAIFGNPITGDSLPEISNIEIKHSAQVFEMPDGKKLDSFHGFVIFDVTANAYWGKKEDNRKFPLCMAPDGKNVDKVASEGIQSQTGLCADCARNQFIVMPDGRKGKECRNSYRLYLMVPPNQVPKRLTIPATSMRNWTDFKAVVIDQYRFMPLVNVKFTLAKKGEGQQVHSIVNFEAVEDMKGTPDAIEFAKAIKQITDLYDDKMRTEVITSEESPNLPDGDHSKAAQRQKDAPIDEESVFRGEE